MCFIPFKLRRCTIHDNNAEIFWVKFNKLCFIFYVGIPLLLNVAANAGLFVIIIKKANNINKGKMFMIVSLSVFSVISWVPAVIYGTVFNSTGYSVFFRFTNYVISVDTTFSTLLFIYFFPSFGSFILGILSCGKRGELSRLNSERKRSRAVSTTVYVPLKTRLSQSQFATSELHQTNKTMPPRTSSRHILQKVASVEEVKQ